MKIDALFWDVFIFLRIEKLWNKDSFCGTNVIYSRSLGYKSVLGRLRLVLYSHLVTVLSYIVHKQR